MLFSNEKYICQSRNLGYWDYNPSSLLKFLFRMHVTSESWYLTCKLATKFFDVLQTSKFIHDAATSATNEVMDDDAHWRRLLYSGRVVGMARKACVECGHTVQSSMRAWWLIRMECMVCVECWFIGMHGMRAGSKVHLADRQLHRNRGHLRPCSPYTTTHIHYHSCCECWQHT